MKSLYLSMLIFSSTTIYSQQLVLQPDANAGIDASLGYHDNFNTDFNNYGTDTYFKAFCIPGASGGRNSNRGDQIRSFSTSGQCNNNECDFRTYCYRLSQFSLTRTF